MHKYNFLRIARMTAPADTAPETGAPPETGGGAGAPPATAEQSGDGGATDEDPPGAEALGDPGKQALDRMKADKKAAEKRAADAEQAAAALQAKLDGKEAEHAAAQEKQRIQDEALAAADMRIAKADARAAAKGLVPDDLLTDVVNMLDLSSVEVSEDGETDEAALKALVEDLLKKKPSLAAQSGRFGGGADGGPRNESMKSIDEQIAEATKAGNHVLAISLKRQRALSAQKS